jgi:hypothetical protein
LCTTLFFEQFSELSIPFCGDSNESPQNLTEVLVEAGRSQVTVTVALIVRWQVEGGSVPLEADIQKVSLPELNKYALIFLYT